MARWQWMAAGVALATVVALAATWWETPLHTLAEPAGPAPTPLAWTAQIEPLAGDGHPGDRDGASAQARFADPMRCCAVPMAVSISLMPVITTGSVAACPMAASKRWRAGRGRVDGPALQASFNTPSGIAADAQGNLYVADTGNHAIRRIGTDGQ